MSQPSRYKTINNAPTDRENLEWLVYLSIDPNEAIISFSRGAELLGLSISEMREWMRDFKPRFDAMNGQKERAALQKIREERIWPKNQ